ncbi:hypothetical protein [[Eubacterium] cellulosolvens]
MKKSREKTADRSVEDEEFPDIYDEEQREEMLEEDEITEAEYEFMAGRELTAKKKKKDSWLKQKETEETVSGELAQKEYQED